MWSIQNIDLALAGTALIWLVLLVVIARVGTHYKTGYSALILVGAGLTFFVLLKIAAYVNSITPPFGIRVYRIILLAFLMAVWFTVNRVNTALYRAGAGTGFSCTLLIMVVLLIFIGIRSVQLF